MQRRATGQLQHVIHVPLRDVPISRARSGTEPCTQRPQKAPRPRGGKERGATSDLGGRLGPGARYLQNLPTWALFRDVGLWPGRWRVSRPAPITAILISPAAFLAIAETLPLGAECLPFVLAARTQFGLRRSRGGLER
jgi:hypothetical protein